LGKVRDSFKYIAKEEGFAVGVTKKRKETKFCEGREGYRTYIYSCRFGGGKNSTYGGEGRMGRDNGVEESMDCGEGGCVDPHLVYVYPVSSYRPPHSPLPKSIHFIPLLLDHPLKILVSGGLRGTHDGKWALEGDQELYQLLLIRKRSLLAMRPANSGGEEERLPCPVEV
jgi:hypothetical protein